VAAGLWGEFLVSDWSWRIIPALLLRFDSAMQLLLEFLPIALFFVAYKFGDLFIATGVLIAAVIVQAIVQWIRHRKISPMMLASAILVMVFGGLTLWLHDATFIKWKPTILYWLLAVAFTGSQFIGEKTFIQRMLGENMQLERALWARLNIMWVVFFLFLGALNIYVANNYEEATWVNFKLFGLMGLTFAFAIAQTLWLSSKLPDEDPPTPDAPTKDTQP
jgi:intracellular septation protein